MSITLKDYREPVSLYEPFHHADALSDPELANAVNTLLHYLVNEAGPHRRLPLSAAHSAIENLRAVMTCREPAPLPPNYLALSDGILQTLKSHSHLTQALHLPTLAERIPQSSYPAATRCSLWRGDITHLDIDGIVNAANEKLLGCFIPFHACIDNAIHWQAGPQLRADCETIMRLQQGHDEKTGTAKITRGYNLPARFVLHTVGPIVRGPLTDRHSALLTQSYQSCLELAAEAGLRSLAFCAISTGVFGFPRQSAAQIALRTVASWLAKHPDRFDRIVFNVFSQEDEDLYQRTIEAAS